MKTLITLIACLLVGCGDGINGDTFIHTKDGVSFQLKEVGTFNWKEETKWSPSYYLVISKQGKGIGRVYADRDAKEVEKIRKFIGKD